MEAPQSSSPPTELGMLRVLASTAGVRVSPLVLGGMSFGQAWGGVLGKTDKSAVYQLLDAFVEAGGNFIDTANDYQNGTSETWVGSWMAERGNRDQIVLATKYTQDYRHFELPPGRSANFGGNHRRSLHTSVRDSLVKLQTDYIDVLYLHHWDYMTSIEEVMDSLHILVEQGKVLYLGVSDTPAWVVSAANTYARTHGKTPFSVYQGRWNVVLRDFEREIIPMARNFGMALVPFGVLGGGKFQTERAVEEREKSDDPVRRAGAPGDVSQETYRKASEALAKVASEQGIESLTAIALAYVIEKAVRSGVHNVFPLMGGRKVEQLQDNIQGLSIKLTHEQMNYLEGIHEFDLGFPSNFIGQDPNVTGFAWSVTKSGNHMAFPQAKMI
ncbi:hypothetical protein FSARC_12287 [Fusarium sarcochroum]|uniref:NADP-dependent oxidoreductase domain-containing protein n=1 Tax=Fusarium sarcochroum TaxID=1208366 RepID=A0A8H4T9W1_9HYPO|nr:hypothetical protein FSARC_12287 [Fusarium sarcochroum]